MKKKTQMQMCAFICFSYAFVIPSFFSVFSAFVSSDVFVLSFLGFSNTVFLLLAFLSDKKTKKRSCIETNARLNITKKLRSRHKMFLQKRKPDNPIPHIFQIPFNFEYCLYCYVPEWSIRMCRCCLKTPAWSKIPKYKTKEAGYFPLSKSYNWIPSNSFYILFSIFY